MKIEIIQKNSRRLGSELLFFALLLVLIEFVSVAQAWDIPADRRITWQGNVGVDGGIPNRVTICTTINASVYGNGITDSTNAIQTAINNCPSDQVVYLPAGTYKVTGTITLNKAITLRGAGMDSTIIANTTDLSNVINIGAGYTSSSLIGISSGYTKGSSQLTLNDASSISVGNFILINELNNPSIPVTSTGYGGTCTWCDQFGGTRTRAQVAKVTGKNNNIIDISPPMFFASSSGRTPSIMKLNTFTQFAGIENLTVKNVNGTTAATNNNIMIMGAANCWVKNVKVDTCGKRCIDMRTYFYRIEIRDNYITKCIDHANSDTCYGTEVAEGSSSLIENNIYDDTSMGPMLMWGASGNVVSYNYAHGVHRTVTVEWFWPHTWTHGAHASFNLWEGNVMTGLNFDDYWASNSYNTAFRNRFVSKDETIVYNPDYTQETAAIITEKDNTYMNIVGNILGLAGWSNTYEVKQQYGWVSKPIYATGGESAGGGSTNSFTSMLRHMNYDYHSNSVKYCGDTNEPGCQGGSSDTTLPASLYLSSKPSWWGNKTWPAIGPDVPGYAIDIPAKDRFNGIAVSKVPMPPTIQ
jgi:hypothetical protein